MTQSNRLLKFAAAPFLALVVAVMGGAGPLSAKADIAELIDAGKIAWSGSATETVTNWVGGELVLKFTKSGTLTIADDTAATARLLVVGGGGAGGTATDAAYGAGGGGGAGGFLEVNDVALAGGTYAVSVGVGGTPNAVTGPGGSGQPSQFVCIANGINHVAGGGGGGGGQGAGVNGGSGGASGGGGSYNGLSASGGSASTANGVFAFAGGTSVAKAYGGGGGGAAMIGEDSASTKSRGGDGKSSDIENPESLFYAGGGGGGRLIGSSGRSGGDGGGGKGGSTSVKAESGDPNTGGGGGGSGSTGIGGAGGSGVVIVRLTAATITKVAVPTPKELIWNKTEQTAFATSPGYVLSGDVAKTAAGTYTATLTLNPGFTWLGREGAAATEPISLPWTIQKLTVPVPAPASFGYDAQAKTGDVALVAAELNGYVTLSGDPLIATNAATYHVTAHLASPANEEWVGGAADPQTFSWTITPVKLPRPMPSADLVYNGLWQAAPLPVSEDYTYTAASVTNAFSAGTYHYFAELKNAAGTANYVWDTAPETEVFHGTWQITQAPNAIAAVHLVGWKLGEPTNAPSVTATWGAETAVYTFATASNATEWATSIELTTANGWTPGVWWVKATIPETANWAGASALAEFVLWENPEEIFRDKAVLSVGGLPADAAPAVITLTFAEDAPKGFSYARAGTDGEGLLFLDAGGNLLPYKIISWNVNGESTVQVQLPSLTAAGTTLTVYWGQRPGTVAPGSNAAGVTGAPQTPTIDWGLVEQDGLKINYWTTLPLVDKTVWYTTESEVGTVTNTPQLAVGEYTNYIYDVYAPTNVFAETSELKTPGFYRWVFTQAAPTDGFAPIRHEIDLRVLGDVSVTAIGGVNGDSGRVLLMNRDQNKECPIDRQGYSDTATTSSTFWEFIANDGEDLPYNLQVGSESILWRKEKEMKLWHIIDCRHGNTFPTSASANLNGEQNYLPWSTTSRSFKNRLAAVTRATVGQIVMRNMTNACVYSSCFMDGVGTLYFDAVNGNANTDGHEYKIVVEIATATTPTADAPDGLAPTDENCARTDENGEVLDPYAYADWRAVEMVPYLRDGSADFVRQAPVKELALAVKNGGTTKNFYRVVVPLDYRGPVRFRIRRVSRDESVKVNQKVQDDPPAYENGKGYILLDNVIASYPAMAANLTTAGWHDLDADGVERQKGKQALGVEGAFSVPYPAAGEKNVRAQAVASHYKNALQSTADTNTFFVSAKMHYRWRYLDQETGAWASVDLNPLNGFRSMQTLDLPPLAGDIEYFFESTLHAPYYKYVDYSGADTTLDFTSFHSEKRDVVTNAAVCTGTAFESRGTNWYVRLREAPSANRSVRLVVRRATETNTVACTLTPNRTWTGYVQTPAADPAGLQVRLEALVPEVLEPAGGVFATNRWALAPDRATLTQLPASVTLTAGGTNDWIHVPCDATTGYLMFTFDDRTLSLTVSHADYQNFNGWNDAFTKDGTFVGTSTEDDKKSGVSSKMKEFTEAFADHPDTTAVEWGDMPAQTAAWKEPFSPQSGAQGVDKAFAPNLPFSSATTPNGWTAENGYWVWGRYLDEKAQKVGSASYAQMALQLKGCGYGRVKYVDTDAAAPRGLEKVSFRARLAQAIDFESMSFSYTGSMLTEKDYTFFAHAALNGKDSVIDYDGDGTVSVLAYYQPMKGCYEFRVTQESLTTNKTGGVSSGNYRLSLYRWARAANGAVAATLLAEKRAVASTALVKNTKNGRYYGGLFISCETDEVNGATKITTGLLNAVRLVGLAPDANTEFVGLVCTDTSAARLKAGTYGVTSKNCPAEIWNPRRWMKAVPQPAMAGLTATEGGTLDAANRKYYGKTKIDITSGMTMLTDDFSVMDGEWAVDASRYTLIESGTSGGLIGRTLPQTLAVDVAPAGTEQWTTLTNVTVDTFSLSKPYTPFFHTYETCSVRLRHVGTDDDPRMDVIVDDIQLWQWAGDDMGGRDSDTWAGADYSGWPNSFYFSSCWLKNHAVVMNAKRTPPDKLCTLRVPLMDGHGTPARGRGLGMLSFEYVNAQENANILVQVAKGVTDSVRLQNGSNDPAVWETVTNFNFAAMTPAAREKGVLSVYLGLHGVQGTMRLLLDPAVVAAVADETDPKRFGEVTIKKIFCRDEPALDITCWWGWNLRMIGNPGNAAYPALDDGQRAYLPDYTFEPADLGKSLVLNNSTEEGCRTDDREAYRQHMPFVQTPTFASNIVGEISFRARLWGTRADEPQQTGEIALYAASSGDLTDDASWKQIARFDVTNRFYTTYTYRTESSEQKYRAFRLGVTGVKGVSDAVSRGQAPVHGAEPVRVLIDEVAVYEAVWPTIGFRYAYPFRNQLDSSFAVTGVVDAAGVPLMDEQPLADEGWSVQAEIEVRQLPDEIDLKTPGREPRVFFSWYASTNVWGYANWRTNAAARRAELARADDAPMVFRGSYTRARDAIVGSLPAQVVQYATEVVYWTVSGIVQTNVLSASEWRTPPWYRPLDYNKTYGAAGDFSAWTVLDDIAPRRVWINEVNLYDGQSADMFWTGDDQWIEIAVPLSQKLTGWKLEYINQLFETVTLCTFGAGGFADAKTANEKDGYVFLTVQNPATRTAGRWPAAGVMDGTWADFNGYGGQLDQTSPVALRLTRASGVVEQEIVCEGENMYAGTLWEDIYNATNHVNDLNAHFPGADFRFVGDEYKSAEAHSLGVVTNIGETAAAWSKNMAKTPGRVNEGQTVPLGYALYPNGDLLLVTARIGGEGHIVQTFGSVVNSAELATAATRKGDAGTNITYVVDKWWEIKEVTANGVPLPGVGGQTGEITVTIGAGQSNNIDVVATAQPLRDLRERFGLTEDNRYRNAVMDWLAKGRTRKYGAFKGEEVTEEAWYQSLAGVTVTNLTLTHRYWLDIDPTEPGWVLKAGVSSAPKPYYADVLPAALLRSGVTGPVEPGAGGTPSYETVENFTIKVKMTLTNETTGAAHTPYTLRGLQPGTDSYQYTGSGQSWTSVTFKVTGDIQNNMPARTRWVPLRYFVFTPGSFDPATHTATIDIWDPFDPYGSPATKGWSNFTNCPVFYSWSIDDRLSPSAIEPLKADATFR